jgi:hypothetical protein
MNRTTHLLFILAQYRDIVWISQLLAGRHAPILIIDQGVHGWWRDKYSLASYHKIKSHEREREARVPDFQEAAILCKSKTIPRQQFAKPRRNGGSSNVTCITVFLAVNYYEKY